MEIDKRHKTLINLWKSSFLVHNDIIKLHSIILENNKRNIEEREVISSKELFPALIAAQALLLSIFKEKIIEKNQYENNLLIDINHFRQIISKIIKIKNNKAYIGTLEFQNEIEAFIFLRNKLLHGEYYLEKDNIHLENNNQTTYFNFSELTDVVRELQNYMETTVKSKNTCIVEPHPYTNHLTMKERLEQAYFNIVNIKIRKKGKRTITYNDMDYFNCYIQTIKNIMHHENTSFTNAIEIFKSFPSYRSAYILYSEYFSTHHLEITFDKTPLNKHPKYETVKKNIINDKNVFYNMDRENPGQFDQENFIPLIEDTINDNRHILTTNALKNYILALSHYILNDGENIYHTYQMAQSKSITFLDDISLISQFVCFYAKFHYGLDELLSNGKNTTLNDLLTNNKLDFTTLNLDEFADPNMTIDIKLTSISEQADKIRNNFQKFYESYLKAKQQYENIINNPKVNQTVKDKIKNNYLLAKERYLKQKELLDKLNEFNLEKYQKYINIVNHIRNAFAHGNVTIKPYDEGDTLRDRKIHIIDIYNGNVTYEKELTYKDFAAIFQVDQNIILKDFVENVTTEETYMELIRDMTYESEDRGNHINKDKLKEWQALIQHYRKQEDENELNYIILAYTQMRTIDEMGENFTIESFCQNTINFIKYFKQEEQKDAIEANETYDDSNFDMLSCYNKIMDYIITYSNNCPPSLKEAFNNNTIPLPQSSSTKH